MVHAVYSVYVSYGCVGWTDSDRCNWVKCGAMRVVPWCEVWWGRTDGTRTGVFGNVRGWMVVVDRRRLPLLVRGREFGLFPRG